MELGSTNLPYGTIKVAINKGLSEQPGVIGATQEHVVVAMNQIYVITQMLCLLLAVNV